MNEGVNGSQSWVTRQDVPKFALPQIPRNTHILRLFPPAKPLPHCSQHLPPQSCPAPTPVGSPRPPLAGSPVSPGREANWLTGQLSAVISCQVSGSGSHGEPAAFPEELVNAAQEGQGDTSLLCGPHNRLADLPHVLRSPAGRAARASVQAWPLPVTIPGQRGR